MTWMFQPVDDQCGGCAEPHPIDIKHDAHYIFWDPRYDNGKGKAKGAYRRVCAATYRAWGNRQPTHHLNFTDDEGPVPDIA